MPLDGEGPGGNAGLHHDQPPPRGEHAVRFAYCSPDICQRRSSVAPYQMVEHRDFEHTVVRRTRLVQLERIAPAEADMGRCIVRGFVEEEVYADDFVSQARVVVEDTPVTDVEQPL